MIGRTSIPQEVSKPGSRVNGHPLKPKQERTKPSTDGRSANKYRRPK